MSKKIVNLLSVLVLAFVLLFGVAGCGKADLKVNFMVQNDANEWVVLNEETVVDGEVALAEAPKKAYYTFAGWFSEEALSNPFTGKELKDNANAYAKYTPNQVKITINGEDQGTKNLIDVVNATYNPGEGLQFNGWYKDSACKVKWDLKDDVTELFAESVAVITYSNGYETLWTEMVKPGTVLGKLNERVVEETNFEAKYIVKDYMSEKNLSYTVNGEAVDFTKAVDKSMDVLVHWNSKISDGNYKLNKRTGNYYIDAYKLPDAPVVSFLSNVTITVKEGEGDAAVDVAKDIVVEGINPYGTGLINKNIKKMIFGEGIKFIKGVTGEAACNVEEVVLPSTLKIIDGSFNNMPLVKEFNIPEGVEVIIGSFWGKSFIDYKTYNLGTPYAFDINVPASVKNMAMVSNNFTFAEGSKFAKEDGRIVLNRNNEKILISDPAAYQKFDNIGRALADTIVVPEGITGIQVGTYNTIFNYLMLPATFKTVNYNEKLSDYKYYVFMEGSSYAFSSNMLFDDTAMADPSSTMGPNAYNITYNLGGYAGVDFSTWTAVMVQSGKVVFATDKLPEGLNPYAFSCDTTGFAATNGKYQPMITVKENEDGTKEDVLNSSVILKDTNNVAYITSTFRWLNGQNTANATVNLEKTGTLNAEEIKAEIIAKMPEAQRANIEAATIKFLVNGEEVTLGEVKADMFVTVEIIEAPKLTINSTFRISCDDFWDATVDPSQYTGDYYVLAWMETELQKSSMSIRDLTGLSKDVILTKFATEVAKAQAAGEFSGSATEEQLVKNIMWSFNNATSVKFMMNGEEVTDLSKITLDNGDVTIDVVVEYAAYATK